MNELPNFSSRQLQAVRAVARYSSFIAASAELNLSQPGLSRIIRSVEETLGVRLFHRSTRHVSLTHAGAEFLPFAERVLRELELATDALTSLREQVRGHVALACPMSIANRIMPSIVVAYRSQHPNVHLEIREGMQGAILSEINSGAIDFGLAIALDRKDDLVVDALCDTTFHVIFRADHPFSQRRSVGLSALRDQQLISLPSSSNLRWVFDGAAARAGFRLNHAITVNTYNTIFEFVRAGQGVAILTRVGADVPRDKELAVRPIDPPRLTAKLALMHLKARPLSPAAAGLKKLIKDHFKSLASV
jgi:LysR family transcriptional regulator, carnitine catabolism transcriptional activator